MTRIIFERRPGVYLPEISAYRTYLNKAFATVETIDTDDLKNKKLNDSDFIWRFMGFRFCAEKSKARVIHEYGSLSVGSFSKLKDKLKSHLNAAPFRRVFLNQFVEDGFSFSDNIPSRQRDMGISDAFFRAREEPLYDFVYAGSLYRSSEIIPFIEKFADKFPNSRILVVGHLEAYDRNRFSSIKNITMAGRVSYEDVPALLAQSRFGLNITPDRYPFNLQTATKILEYCAAGLPVVSNRYRWIENFCDSRNGRFYWLPDDLNAVVMADIEQFAFKVPDVSDLQWRNIIEKSKIFDFLE